LKTKLKVNHFFVYLIKFLTVNEYELTIVIIWSQFFHFKYLWNLQTAHH